MFVEYSIIADVLTFKYDAISNNKPTIGLIKYFGALDDPRVDRNKLHALPYILLIVFCGAVCGVETWEDSVDFGQSKIDISEKIFRA